MPVELFVLEGERCPHYEIVALSGNFYPNEELNGELFGDLEVDTVHIERTELNGNITEFTIGLNPDHELYGFKFPKIRAPKFRAPKFRAPKFRAPKLKINTRGLSKGMSSATKSISKAASSGVKAYTKGMSSAAKAYTKGMSSAAKGIGKAAKAYTKGMSSAAKGIGKGLSSAAKGLGKIGSSLMDQMNQQEAPEEEPEEEQLNENETTDETTDEEQLNENETTDETTDEEQLNENETTDETTEDQSIENLSNLASEYLPDAVNEYLPEFSNANIYNEELNGFLSMLGSAAGTFIAPGVGTGIGASLGSILETKKKPKVKQNKDYIYKFLNRNSKPIPRKNSYRIEKPIPRKNSYRIEKPIPRNTIQKPIQQKQIVQPTYSSVKSPSVKNWNPFSNNTEEPKPANKDNTMLYVAGAALLGGTFLYMNSQKKDRRK